MKTSWLSSEKYAVKSNYENNDEINDENLIFPFNSPDNDQDGGCQLIMN